MNVSTGGSHILIFERDQQLAALLSSELQLAGYECHIARTAVEVFDAIARHQVRLVLVNLAQAAAGRREFWVALDAQRRGRGVLVLTYRCTNLAGYGPYDPEEHRQTVDVEVDGMLGIMRLVEAVRAQVPLPTTASHPQVRLADVPTQASPSPTLTSLQQTLPHPAVFSPGQSQISELQRQSSPAPSAYTASVQSAPSAPPAPTFTDKIRAVIYPGSRSFSPAPAAGPAPASAQEAAWGAAFGAGSFQSPEGFVTSASPSSAHIPAVSPVANAGSRQPPLNQAGQFSPASHAAPSPNQAYYTAAAQSAPLEFYAQQRSQPLEPFIQGPVEAFYQVPRAQTSGPLPQPQAGLTPQEGPSQMPPMSAMTQASPSPFASAPQASQPMPAYQPQPLLQESPYQPSQAYTQYAPPEEKGESSLAQLTRLLRERTAASAPGERGPEPGEAPVSPGGATAPASAASAPPSPLSTASLRVAPIQGLQSDQEPDYRPSRTESHATARSHLQALASASPTIGELSSLRMAAPSSAPAPAPAPATSQPATPTAQPRAYTAEQPAVERRPVYNGANADRAEHLPAGQMSSTGAVERVEREVHTASGQPLPGDDLAATADEETKKEMIHAEAAPVEPARRPALERESITSDTTLLDIVQSLPPMEPPPQRQQQQSPPVLNGRATRSLGSVLLEGHLVPPERLEVAQNVQRMLRGVDLNYQLGEILLMFKLLTPDQLLAASLVSYGLLNTAQIRSLGRIRQELHSMGLEYDLENLLILFRILTPEQLREVRASWSS
ncbi:hypothetical protein [Thermogemmatispora tikiterensis]|uniref:Response regulatory domain-containing protein n=1 Tax=Thermogemmatispora tikiterensis TaxID=1825093 RepID=A0A328VLA6_9CHLR|nr:hypothetical protein [Thermogemmatispora tikiterensis]RAQ97949.1 hypothetical protein A4R35_20590 [Thermogemmatispora tikiterensis]